jgi:O-acetylhomoserine (thiol)-lyase
MGISVTYIDQDSSEEEIQKAFKPNTKCVFGESIANPKISILDIEKFARIAHKNHVPLIIDNTFATPILLRPFEYGADIVVHSTTKYMDGHAICVGGVIVDSGNFDWESGNFPGLTKPDESYHGMVYTRDCGKAAYITKARVQLMRDYGSTMTANTAFLMNLGLETLHLRMERHSENAKKVAEFLSTSDKILSVSYPSLPTDDYYELAQKYLPNGCSGVISFKIKGGREGAVKFMDKLKLAVIVVHVADCRTAVLHPASSTHRQLTDEQLVQAGIDPGLIRFSVGIENVEDIIEDIRQALED